MVLSKFLLVFYSISLWKNLWAIPWSRRKVRSRGLSSDFSDKTLFGDKDFGVSIGSSAVSIGGSGTPLPPLEEVG